MNAEKYETRTTGVFQNLFARLNSDSTNWYPVGTVLSTGDGTVRGYVKDGQRDWLPAYAWEVVEPSGYASLAFDGVDDYASTPHQSALNLTTGFSLELWIKPGDASVRRALLTKGTAIDDRCYALELDGDGRLGLTVEGTDGSRMIELWSSTPVQSGRWTHVAATYSGEEAKVFINGILDVAMLPNGTVRANPAASLTVGSIFGEDAYFGLMDDIRIWSTARSNSEIADTLRTLLTGDEENLVAYWRHSNGQSQSVLDLSGNGHTLWMGEDNLPDASDPLWNDEGFPVSASLQRIYSFGRPSYAIHWKSRVGTNYIVEETTAPSTGDWLPVSPVLEGTGGDLEFYKSVNWNVSPDMIVNGYFRLKSQ